MMLQVAKRIANIRFDKILPGAYAAPMKCEVFWRWALNRNFAGNAGFFLIAKFAKIVYISGICANTWKRT